MNTKAAVLGTEAVDMMGSERDLLLTALTSGLKERAGYMPTRGVFDDEPEATAIQYSYAGYEADRFHMLSKFVQGYGWIAGSSALHFAQNEKIGYSDIDVFCVSQNAYNWLKDYFTGDIISESKRSCVVETPRFYLAQPKRWQLAVNLNLVSPLENQNWSHPFDVLKEFDLSVAAIAIIEPGLAYTPYAEDITKKEMNFIGNIRNAVLFWRRVIKYYRRGFKLAHGFFDKLIQDDKGRDLVYLMADMYDLNISQRHKDFDGELLWAQWAVNDYEQGDYVSDSTDNDDGYDEHDNGWY